MNPSKNVIRLSKSCIGDEEKNAVTGVLDREYLGMGSEVQLFESNLTEYFGRPAVCVVNGTAAVHLACQAAGLGPGDEVLVQSLTFVASFQAIAATGAKPVGCDVLSDTLTLDIADAKKRITSRTKAVMPVHYSGGVGNLDEIYDFARKNNLRVIEDAAHAFGTEYKGKKVGGFGDIACFSFDGIKNITSGEGGCIVTEDEDILAKIRDARLLGVEKDTEKRYAGQRSWEFDVLNQGWRYHMSNIMAAIGIEQLKKFGRFSSHRKECANFYLKELEKIQDLQLLDIDYTFVTPHIFVILVAEDKRSMLMNHLRSQNIECGVHYQPNHMLTYFKTNYSLPVTEMISKKILTIPLHADLTRQEQSIVVSEIKKIMNQ
jgi:dTDP-4-amino-4,6-dideoxygalactose transaminase